MSETFENCQNVVVQIQWKQSKCAYFSCSPHPLSGIEDHDVCLNATYARTLGIEENEQVYVSFHTRVQSLTRIYITPVSLDDYEVLALSYDTIQSSLLDQIRIVWNNQRLLIWLSSSFCINISVDKLEPEVQFGKLESFTEVVVLSPENNSEVYAFENIDTFESDAVQDPTSAHALQSEPASHDYTSHDKSSYLSWMDYLRNLFYKKSKEENSSGDSKKSCLMLDFSTPLSKHIVCRVHPLDCLLSYANVNMRTFLEQPCNIVLIHRRNFNKLMSEHINVTADDIMTCKVTKLPFEMNDVSQSIDLGHSKSHSGSTEDVNTIRNNVCFYSKLCIIEDLFKTTYHNLDKEAKCLVNYSSHNCIYMNNLLRESSNVTIAMKVNLEIVPTNVASGIIEVGVKPTTAWDETVESIETLCRNHFVSSSVMSPYLLCSNAVVKVSLNKTEDVKVFIKILHPDLDYVILTSVTASTCKVKVLNDLDVEKVIIPCHESEIENVKDVALPQISLYSGLSELIEKSVEVLQISLLLHPSALKHEHTKELFKSFNILLIGKSGMGKTFIAKSVCERLSLPPYYVHCEHVQCRHLKGKKVESVEKLLVHRFSKCLYYQPSLIILDDIDVLVPSVSSALENSTENSYYTRLGERIVELLEEYQSLGHIGVLGTASSLNKINSAFVAPRGCQIFKLTLHIPELTKEYRLQSLQQIVKHCPDISPKSLDCINMDSIAQQCDGYVIQDLLDLVNKSVFEAWRKSGTVTSDNKVILKSENFEKTLKNMVPLSLRGVDLFQSSPLTWEDIGGLKDVKQTLLEVFYWPSQYPELFDKPPLRHQSGLLLYGAPGTGKTLLAGVIAHECGLKFISVKGPELLSKYIGASEEGVRNIFLKAQSAKPCILFFDEFDSLAPRRGHDSTGVTDRVVNQLLTQLDGVESLNGVWVMAATSRPDLLDPALLRPGRLDKAVYCPLPSLEDRLSILQALSRKLHLSEDVDLRKIAENSNSFTGADLHAVMYTAQLTAFTKKDIPGCISSNLPDLLPVNKNSVSSVSNSTPQAYTVKSPVVLQAHLLAALQDTRPSLSVQERQKYHNIYTRFVGKNEYDYSAVSQRATLA